VHAPVCLTPVCAHTKTPGGLCDWRISTLSLSSSTKTQRNSHFAQLWPYHTNRVQKEAYGRPPPEHCNWQVSEELEATVTPPPHAQECCSAHHDRLLVLSLFCSYVKAQFPILEYFRARTQVMPKKHLIMCMNITIFPIAFQLSKNFISL
jgi:hypothetical protein